MLVASKRGLTPKKRILEYDRGDKEQYYSSAKPSLYPSPPSSKHQRYSPERCDPDGSLAALTQSPDHYDRTTEAMNTESPSSFPKHVIVPHNLSHHKELMEPRSSYREYYHDESPPRYVVTRGHIVTPLMHGYEHDYEGPTYSPDYYHGSYGDGYRHATHLPTDFDLRTASSNVVVPPKLWACDFCCLATFPTFKEACIHEKSCSQRAEVVQHTAEKSKKNCGLGALYNATKELQQESSAGGRGGEASASEQLRPPALSPRFQDYNSWSAKACSRATPSRGPSTLLVMPRDKQSLSDRQCFVRSDFVEIFAATDHDVSFRHSKGAQKLHIGQIGIRCSHCAHLRPKDRAERAVCYPSSVNRIYQTVADMQRFHFEHCEEIPRETQEMYKSLKTTRPRGVGSPQEYWVKSAKLLNLIDTEEGIRFGSPPSSSRTKSM